MNAALDLRRAAGDRRARRTATRPAAVQHDRELVSGSAGRVPGTWRTSRWSACRTPWRPCRLKLRLTHQLPLVCSAGTARLNLAGHRGLVQRVLVCPLVAGDDLVVRVVPVVAGCRRRSAVCQFLSAQFSLSNWALTVGLSSAASPGRRRWWTASGRADGLGEAGRRGWRGCSTRATGWTPWPRGSRAQAARPLAGRPPPRAATLLGEGLAVGADGCRGGGPSRRRSASGSAWRWAGSGATAAPGGTSAGRWCRPG